jgi:hypothetical protein
MSQALDEKFLLEKLVLLTRSLGRVPVVGDLLRAAMNDPTFPSRNSFRRLGSKSQWAPRVMAYCEANTGNEDVAILWRSVTQNKAFDADEAEATDSAAGFVYLLRHGSRHEYKIGCTYNPLRREGEIEIQLPEKLQPVHYIKTDDPSGVENYWHRRFADKRKEGEWFALSADDLRAFKKWKRIY